MKRFLSWPMVAIVGLTVAGCGSSESGSSGAAADKPATGGGAATAGGAKSLVAFAQANSADPWRQVFDAETKTEAQKFSGDMTLEEQSAEDKADTQISQIDTMLLKQPKVLLVSATTEAVQAETDKAFDAGVPVILLDRAVPGDKFTCLVGGDNVDIGRQAAEFIAQKLNGKGTVLMIQGLGGASATADRKKGAMDAFAKFPGIKVIEGDDCKYQREAAQNYMQTFLQSRKPFDAIYAHNDEMAIGAYTAWMNWDKTQDSGVPRKRPLIVGIDGCQKEMIDMIKDGKIDATFMYPIPGPKGIDIADDILKGKKPTDKKVVLPTQIVTKDTAGAYETANPNLAK
jgi:ribose transport system substrate-binding protein